MVYYYNLPPIRFEELYFFKPKLNTINASATQYTVTPRAIPIHIRLGVRKKYCTGTNVKKNVGITV
jgi:hypothetical protein